MALSVALLALVGCGADDKPDSKPSSSSSAAPSPSATPDAAYGSVEDLKDAAVAAGYMCRRWRVTNKVALAAESGNCSASDVFTTYASDGDLQHQLNRDKGNADLLIEYDIDPGIALVGPNWMIHGDDAKVRPLQDALGGTIVDPQS